MTHAVRLNVLRLSGFLEDLYIQRKTIVELSKNDFRARYLESYLGITWAFVQPLATILILWFVFEMGFKVGAVNDCPFVLWLMAGLLPWNFFAEALMNGMNSIREQSYLVKKVVFKVSILPLVKILSALIVHLVFIILMVGLFWASGRPPTLYALQIPYYLLLTILLVLGLSWLTASLVIFVPDLREVISILLQFGFWLTPIFWSLSMVPDWSRFYIKLNPMYYVVNGYRDALIDHVWFWERPALTLYFFGVMGIVFLVGSFMFIKLRPHFADVL